MSDDDLKLIESIVRRVVQEEISRVYRAQGRHMELRQLYDCPQTPLVREMIAKRLQEAQVPAG